MTFFTQTYAIFKYISYYRKKPTQAQNNESPLQVYNALGLTLTYYNSQNNGNDESHNNPHLKH